MYRKILIPALTIVVLALAISAALLLTGHAAPPSTASPTPSTTSPASTPRAVVFYLVAQDSGSWVAVPSYGEDPDPTTADRHFDTMREAIGWASVQPSQYGVRVADGTDQ